ncbi:HAMP domain-containing histidine kinase [Acidiferrimicrobium sp. IK]|uniref:sensor histidine kinase n=1 Tax=Acidiferrimicrobium sp. IK TaxID=2871700 RepID=UPI0021CB5D1F|nr:HAMP domain-containing sensor histidine kinase [Acidiferrimicrobium sp. IK]MCU4183590.1 HAMP domain-containing histidine kinase [Acidiferrimicrobium sp. IK]
MRAWLRKASFRSRVTVLVAVAVGFSVALAALLSYFVVHRELYRQVDDQLASDLQLVTSSNGPIDLRQATFLFGRVHNGDILQIIGSSGVPSSTSVVLSTGTVSIPVSAAEQAMADGRSSAAAISGTVSTSTGTYRVETIPARDATTGSPLAIRVVHRINDILYSLRELRLVLLLVGLAGLAVAIALGYAVARVTIRPVERLTGAAEHVAATQDLDATIEDDGDDELARLAHAFNAMLAALRASRSQQAQLVSDAGHELRTPLTSLRTNIEVLLRTRDLPEADRAELLGDVRAQLEELTTLIGDIVELARQEETQPEPTEIRLDSLVEHAVERARRRALSVTFDVHLDRGSVRAQPALLERAVLNVLDNAAKWSPAGGRVEVTLRRSDHWTLDVRDHGPGIAPSDLPRVFDRFYRAQTARSLPGSGLGLAIVAQVVRSHGGVVTPFLPPDGGTLMRIELPIVAESEAGHELGGGHIQGPPGGDVASLDETVPSASSR